METTGTVQGWEVRDSGPAGAPKTVLLIAGAMCSGEFYVDVMAEPALASHRLVAATIPGFGRTTPLPSLDMAAYATSAGQLAADVGADVVVGHSLGANIALEMAAAGAHASPIVLLSPSFSRKDEAAFLGVLDKLGRVPLLGRGIWWLAMKAMPSAMKKQIPEARRAALVADVANNDPRFCRRSVHAYFEYLDKHGSLVDRLCGAAVPAWVAFGDNDEIELQDDEREGLEACPGVTLVTVPDATHMVLIDQPARTAELVVAALGSVT